MSITYSWFDDPVPSASDLDNKLKALLSDAGLEDEIDVTVNDYVEQIKQAIAEAGYVQLAYNPVAQTVAGKPIANVLQTDDTFMTGQEWYQRLGKHLNAYNWTQDEKDSILQAAFEVSEGLDHD